MDLGLLWGAVAAIAGVVTVAVAVAAWRRPKVPPQPAPAPHETLAVDVHYAMPLFDRPDGTRQFGDDLIGVTARNGTGRPVRATGWGVLLPGHRRMVVMHPTTTWEPPLPHWIAAGDQATWYLSVDEARSQASAQGCEFDDMLAYVSFADGREVAAPRGLPLR